MDSNLSGLWASSLGALVLLLLNGLLVAAELALIKIRFSHFDTRPGEAIAQSRRLSKLVENPDPTVRLIRFGGVLCTIGYSLLVLPLLRLAFSLGAAQWGQTAGFAAGALALFAVFAIFYACGELAPRSLALSFPVPSLRLGSIGIALLGPLRPISERPINNATRQVLKRLGVKDQLDIESLDLEAQIELVGESRPITSVAQTIFRNALQMRDLEVSDVMLPRHQVQWFDLSDDLEANLELARNTGHTRFPLCEGDLDRCIGLVHIKDIFRRNGDASSLDLRQIRRDIMRVAPDEGVEEALQKLLGARMHMALVVDEFRGAEGIITLERILELLVGDIRDEFDVEEDNIKPLPGGEFSVSGLTPLHEVEQALDVEIENEDVSTFGGLITAELGRIPEREEQLELEGLVVTVTETDERRVIRARVKRLERVEDED